MYKQHLTKQIHAKLIGIIGIAPLIIELCSTKVISVLGLKS